MSTASLAAMRRDIAASCLLASGVTRIFGVMPGTIWALTTMQASVFNNNALETQQARGAVGCDVDWTAVHCRSSVVPGERDGDRRRAQCSVGPMAGSVLVASARGRLRRDGGRRRWACRVLAPVAGPVQHPRCDAASRCCQPCTSNAPALRLSSDSDSCCASRYKAAPSGMACVRALPTLPSSCQRCFGIARLWLFCHASGCFGP
eukprot:3863377-Rhodomonas_salina.10